MSGASFQAANKNTISHDKAAAKDCLECFDPSAEKFAFQFISDGPDRKPSSIVRATLEEAWAVIEKLNTPADGVGVFVLPNSFTDRLPRVLIAAANNNEQIDRASAAIEACGATPNMIVENGGRLQICYVCPDIPLDQLPALQRDLSVKLGTDDPAVADLSRVRLPGTLQLADPTKPQLVKLFRNDGVENWKLDNLRHQLGLSAQGQRNPLAIARGYLKRGWNPVPVSRQTKKPFEKEWQKRRVTEETLVKRFSGTVNVGVQMGPMSGGLTDVDLDCREAVAIGPMLLPQSNNVFGRASKPRSHWLYVSTLADKIAKAALQFKDVDGTMMLELRIGGGDKGSQSVFPGSMHESGEAVEWDRDGALVTVDDDALLQKVRRLAVAVMLARHWPTEGARHDAALTVGGFLARAGLDEDEVALILEAIASAAGDEQAADRVRAARDAVKQHGNGGETRGLQMLMETFDEKVATKVAQWLNYSESQEPHDEHDELIAEWNTQHAHVLAGAKSCVLLEFKTPEGYTDFKLLSSRAFHEWYIEHRTKKKKPVTKLWMAHPKRRKYQDIGFFPGRDMPDYYNLWRGFAVEPRKGDCSKFLAHMYENVCQGNDELYTWVMAWFADMFQRPAEKCGTSLTLRGKQGVGKTKVGQVMRGLLGGHYKLVADPRYVTGQFNSHLIALLMLHADEGFWAGDKKAEGKLKDLITGDKHPIEFKGKEAFWVDNYVRLLVSGNPDWQVPAGFEERRFAVLDVGEAHMQDHAYFAAIDVEMDAGGREALLYHLLFEVDCSKVNLRKIPHTTALLEQKLETASPEHGWWLDILSHGVLPGSRGGFYGDTVQPNEVWAPELYNDYIEHAKKQGAPRRVIETKIGMFLKKVVGPNLRRGRKSLPSVDHYSTPGPRERCYTFPPLSECRRAFAALLNEQMVWWREGEEDWA